MTDKKKNSIKRNLQAYGFLTPFLVLVSLLYILPAILTVVMAFTDLDSAFIWEFAGLKNFRKIFSRSQYDYYYSKYSVVCSDHNCNYYLHAIILGYYDHIFYP